VERHGHSPSRFIRYPSEENMHAIARLFWITLAVASLSTLALAKDALADHHECRCLAIAGDVPAALLTEIARADGLYARGDFEGAFAIYARVYASVREPVLLYAQAMAKWQLGAAADARALFQAYLAVGGALAYRDRAEVGLRELGGVVGGTVGGVVGGGVGAVRGVGGITGGVVGGVAGVGGGVAGGVRGGVDTGLGVVGGVTAKPKKIAKGAAVVLGVVAVAALGALAIHGLAAGIKDDISLDAKFDLSMGITGVTVGATALYVGSLTVAAGAVGGAAGGLRCATLPPKKPIVAPMAMHGGGGLVTAMSF
jgi:hypothetical protein